MTGLVSIVMPVLNGERFLQCAVESVREQRYSNWELLIVDDGSTDSTPELIRSMSDTRISCVWQPNSGVASARNRGLRESRGEYLLLLDADDRLHPDYLSRALGELDLNRSIDAVICQVTLIDAAGRELPVKPRYSVTPATAYAQLLRGGFFPLHAVLLRSALLASTGIFDTTLSGMGLEDWDFWLRVAKAGKMKSCSDRLAYYRVYPGSMATNAARMHACRLSVVAKRFGSLTESPADWPEEKRMAFGYAQRAGAIDYSASGRAGTAWEMLAAGARAYPAILSDVSTYYELICAKQERGFRGMTGARDALPDVEEVLAGLTQVLNSAGRLPQGSRGRAVSTAYWAAAMLLEHSGDWSAARGFMRRAVIERPELLTRGAAARRLLKLHLGRPAAMAIRKVRKIETA